VESGLTVGAQRDGFVVKIRIADSSEPAGVGFVVGEKHIVTCAHVVNVALRRAKGTRNRPAENARVQVEFVLLGDAEGAPIRNCRIDAWDPPLTEGVPGRDTAGLVVVGGDSLPTGAGPARLLGPGAELNNAADLFGHPGNPPRKINGAWSTCLLRGAVGGGRIQLDRESQSALRVQPGYSGAPVVIKDQWGDAVVAMLAVAGRENDTSDAYAVSSTEIAAAWPSELGSTVSPACPYRGLQTFSEADAKAGLFVGREREIERLQEMIETQSLALVVGPSGVGKSSLLAAGLTPALMTQGWAVASFRPGTTPYESLARALLDLEGLGTEARLEDLDHRVSLLRTEGFWKVASRVALAKKQRIVIILDQLEEVLSSGPDMKHDTISFLRDVFPVHESTLDANVRLVCTLRSDYLPKLLDRPDIGSRIQDRQLNMAPLGAGALTRVIVEPAITTGVTFSEGLPERIAAETSEGSGGLPLLQFALTELWSQQRDHQITYDNYHALGGVSGALNRHAEHVFRILTERVEISRIRRVLLSMVRARSGAADAVRATARRDHLKQDWAVAQIMAAPQNRLVVLGTRGPDSAEIAHESLIRGWQRFAHWVDEDVDFQKWLARTEERASDNDLLSAQRVTEALEWLEERPEDIPQEVAQFIDDSNHELLVKRTTESLLRKSQVLTGQLKGRSLELERRQQELAQSNAQLEEKAEQLARTNQDIEIKNRQIEEAHRVLQERTEKLSAAMRYKSDFLASMSHELRTPLSALLILAKLLSDNAEGNLSSKQVDFAETIYGAGCDLLQIVDDTLDISKVESGRMELHSAPLRVAQFIDYIDATFRPLAAEKRLNFSTRVLPGVPPRLYVDASRLLQVLRNLLSNALKFTEAGEVALTVRNAALCSSTVPEQQLDALKSARSEDAALIDFSVSDTGIGIDHSNLQVIFEAFKQANDSTGRKYGGTGLGLSICQEVTRLLGGGIHVTSTPGQGSIFTLYLPVNLDGAPSEEDFTPFQGSERRALLRGVDALQSVNPDSVRGLPASGQAIFGGEKVLIVDDDIRNVFALTSLFEEAGLVVLYAENGVECLEVLKQHEDVSLIVMDILMPGLDGYATTSEIRKLPRYASLPIIALTGKALEEDREKCLVVGASEHVAKPASSEGLLSVMRRWIYGPGRGGR
jgi:signal transduction histidine kinase